MFVKYLKKSFRVLIILKNISTRLCFNLNINFTIWTWFII